MNFRPLLHVVWTSTHKLCENSYSSLPSSRNDGGIKVKTILKRASKDVTHCSDALATRTHKSHPDIRERREEEKIKAPFSNNVFPAVFGRKEKGHLTHLKALTQIRRHNSVRSICFFLFFALREFHKHRNGASPSDHMRLK